MRGCWISTIGDMFRFIMIIACALLAGCAPPSLDRARWRPLNTGSTASLRGISAPGDGVVWASGTGGSVLRSLDGGETWRTVRVPGPDSIDVRDIEAIDADHAWAMCITEPARVLYTNDGGASWAIRHTGRAGAFFDSIARFTDGSVVLFGDPHEGVFDISHSEGGGHWQAALESPRAHHGEAAFAASGTCIVTVDDRYAWIGTGGMHARVLRSVDGGRTWLASRTPMRQGSATTGIYSVAFRDRMHGVVVGGDYTNPELSGDNAAYTTDGGETWITADIAPEGYRSGVVYLANRKDALVAVGRAGCSYSTDGGVTWRSFADPSGFYAVASSPDGEVYAVGSDGRAAKLVYD